MTISEALQSGNYEEVKKLFKRPEFDPPQEEVSNQYEVSDHDIFDETKGLKAWNLRFNGPAIFGDGSMVGQWHREAIYEHIQRHCASNIVATRYLYDRLQRVYLAKVTTNR